MAHRTDVCIRQSSRIGLVVDQGPFGGERTRLANILQVLILALRAPREKDEKYDWTRHHPTENRFQAPAFRGSAALADIIRPTGSLSCERMSALGSKADLTG